MFSNSSRIIVTGGVFNNIDNRIDALPGLDKGLELLYPNVATDALHNSGERFDPPKCHPNTRTAILQEILDWLNAPSPMSASMPTNHSVNEEVLFSDNRQGFTSMWIHGPAGSGKSAIAQSVAEKCFDLGQLSSAFFFSRTRGTVRRDEKRLVATLAYQMVKHVPETQPFISGAIFNDPLVFSLSLESQMETLIVKPLSSASDTLSGPSQPRLIIIDGLDECVDAHIQSIIVNTLITAIGSMQHNIPHKLLFLSRPEPHLVSLFNERRFRSTLRKLLLDDRWHPDEDIRLFLVENFQRIKSNHPLSHLLMNWPEVGDIDELVRRSSGHFVYASTVVKALKVERNHPIEVLNIILSLRKSTKNRLYAELDALYDHIFSRVTDLDTVLQILRIALARSIEPPIVLRDPGKIIQSVLGLSDGMLEISLSELSAVVSVTRTVRQVEIQFLHASLADYLLDESRSGKYFINSDDICVELYRRCLNFMLEDKEKAVDSQTVYHLRMAFSGPIHFAHHVQDRRLDIHRWLSDLDLESTLSFAADNAAFQAHGLLADITEFIVWGLREYKESVGSNRDHLSKFVKRFQNWVFARLERFPFNGFDNDLSLDLTVFAMSPTSLLRTVTTKGFFNTMIDILTDVIQANPSTIQVPQELGNELALCWSLMPGLATFFEDAEFAGRYAMTPKRYCDAAVLCLLHLLREEPPQKKKGDEKWVHTRHNYLQTMKYATFFLIGAEARVDMRDLCQKIVQISNDEENDTVLKFDSEHEFYSVVFAHINRLIGRLAARTGGLDNPWNYDVNLTSGLSLSVTNYLFKTCKTLSLESCQEDPQPQRMPVLNTLEERPWTQSSSTMRWFWWYDRNVLRWVKPDGLHQT